MKHYVQIIAFEGDTVVKEMGPMSERQAEKVDAGANINLNYDDYYTQVIEKEKAFVRG